MIKKIKMMGLRKQLVILYMACIIIVLATQLFYNISIFAKNTSDSTEKCYSTLMQTNSMIDQVLDRINSIGESVVSNQFTQEFLYLNNSKSDNFKRRRDLIQIIHNNNKNIIDANNMLIDLVLIDRNDTIYSSTTQFSYGTYKLLQKYYDIEQIDKGCYTSSLNLNFYANKSFAYIIPIYYTTGNFNLVTEKLGTCIVWVKNTPLLETVNATAASKGATVSVTDGKGNILALNSSYAADEIKDEIEHMIANYSDFKEDNVQTKYFRGRKSFVLINKQENTGWNSINIVPTKEVYEETFDTLYLGIGVSIISIFIISVFCFYMANNITRPLKQITSALDKIGKENRKYRIVVSEKNEFGIISDSINDMLDNMSHLDRRIFDMQSQLYEKELKQKEAEMLTLQSQINPHFLYNTLECIRSISVVHNIKEIQIITTSMAKIFRYSIKGGNVTTIKSEIDCLNDYFKIISIRYNERITLYIDMEESLLQYSILKLSLQPVLENTVNHCLEATENDVTVHIKGYLEEEYVILIISDDGVGIEAERLQELNMVLNKSLRESFFDLEKPKGSIGLANINLRMKLHYGEDCGLHVESMKDAGTTIRMKIRVIS